MKKILLVLCILLVGCSKPTIYDTYVKNLKENNNISTDIPFDIEFYIVLSANNENNNYGVQDSLGNVTYISNRYGPFYIDNVNENRIIYQVIIDNPQIETDNVTALVIHDGKTNDIFPSVGIVDEPINLNIDKGIILLGYIDQTSDINFKVLIETNNQQYIYEYKY